MCITIEISSDNPCKLEQAFSRHCVLSEPLTLTEKDNIEIEIDSEANVFTAQKVKHEDK